MEVKGRAIKSIQKCVRKKFGKDGFNRWLNTISAAAFAIYSQSIDIEAWYPLKDAIIEPSANIAQLFYKWDLKAAAWDFGRYSADFGMKGPARLFARFMSTEFLMEKAGEILPSYYKSSEIRLLENSKGKILLQVTKFPGIDNTIEYRIGGWVERALEINGCKDIEVEITKSLARSEAYTEYQVSWTV